VKWGVGEFLKHCERIFHLCDTKRVEDEKHFLLECFPYTHIRSQFQNICYNIDLPNLLTHQNYDDLGMLLLTLFQAQNRKSKPNNLFPFLRYDIPNLVLDVNHHHHIKI
jgi:hypothetical protein